MNDFPVVAPFDENAGSAPFSLRHLAINPSLPVKSIDIDCCDFRLGNAGDVPDVIFFFFDHVPGAFKCFSDRGFSRIGSATEPEDRVLVYELPNLVEIVRICHSFVLG